MASEDNSLVHQFYVHQKWVWLSLLTVILVTVGVWGGASYTHRREARDGRALSEAMALLEPQEGATEPDATHLDDARKKFDRLVKKDRGQVSAWAALSAGDICVRQNDLVQATTYFTYALDHTNTRDPLYALVASRLAYLQESQGKLPEAQKTWERVGHIKQETAVFGQDEALFQEARLLHAQAKDAEAGKILEDAEKRYTTSSWRDSYASLRALLSLTQSSTPSSTPSPTPSPTLSGKSP